MKQLLILGILLLVSSCKNTPEKVAEEPVAVAEITKTWLPTERSVIFAEIEKTLTIATMNQFLNAVEEKNMAMVTEMSCVPSLNPEPVFPPIQDWKITGIEEKIHTLDVIETRPGEEPQKAFEYPYGIYTAVAAEVKLLDLDKTETWTVSIWNTDDLYEAQVRYFKLPNLMAGGSEATVESDIERPEREELSSGPYCLYNIMSVVN